MVPVHSIDNQRSTPVPIGTNRIGECARAYPPLHRPKEKAAKPGLIQFGRRTWPVWFARQMSGDDEGPIDCDVCLFLNVIFLFDVITIQRVITLIILLSTS